MATAKKGAKNNKTAHVLNLLTAPGGEKEAESPAAGAAPETDIPAESAAPESTAARPLAPPILEVARSNDDQISSQIRDALESELLADELGVPPPAAEPAPDPVPAPAPAPEPAPFRFQ